VRRRSREERRDLAFVGFCLLVAAMFLILAGVREGWLP
jgi:hypothetical protein